MRCMQVVNMAHQDASCSQNNCSVASYVPDHLHPREKDVLATVCRAHLVTLSEY